ncbi:MAG: peptide ABC transporter substrate-binding protein [Acetobacteraceae bacterium]|nr:peptide ABC transporter substrate-binding protein [Acetobacteraceae bacterium]
MSHRNRWAVVVVAVGAAICLLASLAVGCAKKPANVAEVQLLRYNLGTEPETLDSAKATGQPEFTVINALFEGLVRLDAQYLCQPAMASSWEVSPDGKTYTFHLRKGIKWSNGDPVTANDFAYAWMRVLNPETAADYAYQLYYIKGGQAYNEGKGPAEEVGIKVKDPSTLEVTLEAPCPYFLSLMAFPTYFPVHKATVEANANWAAEAATMVSNGPFKLTKWEHHSVLEMAPNEHYWDRAKVKLQELKFFTVEESSTELTMFETGELEVGDNPPLADLDRLKAENKVIIGPDLAVYYYLFNVERAPLNDVRVRKALTFAIDRQSLVTNVTKAGQTPAMAITPYGIPNPVTKKDFREEGGNYFKDNDVATAQTLLAEAGFPGGQNMPPIEVLYNTSQGHKTIAEAIQEMWKKNLGITNLTLTNQEWGVYLATRDARNFQIARAGWGADYLDPMTFLDMWTKDNGNNNTGWWHPDFEAMVASAKATGDQKVRFETMHKLEKLLMDEMPIAPIYFYTDPYMVQPYVAGMVKYSFGPSIDFKNAYVTKH